MANVSAHHKIMRWIAIKIGDAIQWLIDVSIADEVAKREADSLRQESSQTPLVHQPRK
jgi:hypothetical protein